MLLEYRKFNSTRNFGVEFEVSPNFTREELSNLVQEFEKNREKPRSVRVEGTLSNVNGWGETYSNDYWHIKYDSTCGPLGKKKDNGWEIASYIASGNEDVQSIGDLAQYLNDLRVETNKNCGLHIHADVSDFKQKEMGILHSHWFIVEKLILQSVPSHRRNNKYCQPFSKKHSVQYTMSATCPESLWNSIKPTNFYPHENNDKKVVLNSVGYAHGLYDAKYSRKTLELRLPECILEKDHVENWIRLYLHFIDTTKNRDFIDYSAKTSKNNLDYCLWVLGLEENGDAFAILDEPLHKLKLWFLNRIIKNSTIKSLQKSCDKKINLITI